MAVLQGQVTPQESETGRARVLETVGTKELAEDRPFVMEISLAGGIAFRELDFAPEPDGMIFDPALDMASAAGQFPSFESEPFDLPMSLLGFDRPVTVLSGDRDLRTPRPIAERTAALLPDAVLVPAPGVSHSAPDTHPALLRAVTTAVRDARHRQLPSRSAELARLPREGGSSVWLQGIVRAHLGADRWRTAPRAAPIPRT
ncbi:alpha/beta fold hydrolase [Kocuria nitroreducens]|uniref:alpha/beta fold hydrolase n=1 Tax=Kocuria nitroreducens TaxID=3058914 RepID=UPI0036DC56A9